MPRDEPSDLFVVSHVGRDLLQSAALFRSEALVVWEYVSNGLQYVEPGRRPEVRVHLEGRRKTIRITDNGRGMSWEDLQRFFVMHGENQDRRMGRPGRGMFGTGKAAAFGIAEVLRVTTTRGGLKSRVELRRTLIERMGSGDAVPVVVLEKDRPSPEPNGTEVVVEEIRLQRLDQAKVVRYIEQHLARWRDRNAQVFVNNRLCEVAEPEVNWERVFRPDLRVAPQLAGVELTIRVARAPLDEESRGVAVYSNGNWHENTLAGGEGKECAQYIFGEVDVPALESDASLPAAFDMSRSMRLNPENETVRMLYGFLGPSVEEVRRELVAADRTRRETEEAKRLARQAAEIADLLNEDFRVFQRQVAAAHGSPNAAGLDATHRGGDSDLLGPGDAVLGRDTGTLGSPGAEGDSSAGGGAPRNLRPTLERDPDQGASLGDPAGRGRSGQTGGGFRVRFDSVGRNEKRAVYLESERTILVNLDHPQMAAARGDGSVEEITFKRLALEVALTEYAVALAQLLANRDELVEPSEALFHVRDTIDRLTRKAALLFERGRLTAS